MIDLKTQKIEISNVLIDPNNPRFFEVSERKSPIPEEKYSETIVQNEARRKMKDRDLIENIKRSIRTNGYIPTELIVVKSINENSYVVIEGNRRIAAIKDILEDIALSEEEQKLQESLKALQMLVYEPTGDAKQDKLNETILQGLRHVSGPIPWGAYQKASLIARLHDEMELGFQEIDDLVGLGPRKTPRYYRAYKALEQMMKDEEFGRSVKSEKFSLFEEAIRKPSIQKWLAWDDHTGEFTNATHKKYFYTLIAGDEENGQKPKINNPEEMRQFGQLLAEEKSLHVNRIIEGLLDVRSAYLQAFPPDGVPLIENLKICRDALQKLSTDETRNLEDEELKLFDEIVKLIETRKKDHRALNQ